MRPAVHLKQAMAVTPYRSTTLIHGSTLSMFKEVKHALTRRLPPGCAPAAFNGERRPRDVGPSGKQWLHCSIRDDLRSTFSVWDMLRMFCQNTTQNLLGSLCPNIRVPRAVDTVGPARAAIGVRRRYTPGRFTAPSFRSGAA